MNRRVLILPLLLCLGRVWADSDVPDTRDETTSDQEWETKGVIPQGGMTVSTEPITPITIMPDRHPYDQGLEELTMAQDLLKKGNFEASSDIALESYDDLMGIHMPRKSKGNKKKRQKLRDDRQHAATVYTDSSIAYIEEYVKKNGNTKHAIEEGRARLGDLRDVTQNYPELTKKLNKALETYTPQPPIPLFVAVSTATVAPSTPTFTMSPSTPVTPIKSTGTTSAKN